MIIIHKKLFLLLFFCFPCYANVIVVAPKTIINKSIAYENSILDLSKGFFYVTENATLTIKNSIVQGIITPDNSQFFNVVKGTLILKNNKVNVKVENILPDPIKPSLYNVINILEGTVQLIGNDFDIDKSYTVGLLTTKQFLTANFKVVNNKIVNLHGGILLHNSHDAIVANNVFRKVSNGNIFILNGKNNIIENNSIMFPGNNNVGDGIDIVDGENIIIRKNLILSGSCYSVVILRGKDILIDSNSIAGGITYAIIIIPSLEFLDVNQKYLYSIAGNAKLNINNFPNKSIVITNNYLSQNRFGLTAIKVTDLIVKNNIFIQYFKDKASRKFWTDYDILFKDVLNVTWENNLYKEAFNQDIFKNDELAKKFVNLPLHGGVIF